MRNQLLLQFTRDGDNGNDGNKETDCVNDCENDDDDRDDDGNDDNNDGGDILIMMLLYEHDIIILQK